MLIKFGASVNAMDLWQFTPLHEAASKSRVEVSLLSVVDLNVIYCVGELVKVARVLVD